MKTTVINIFALSLSESKGERGGRGKDLTSGWIGPSWKALEISPGGSDLPKVRQPPQRGYSKAKISSGFLPTSPENRPPVSLYEDILKCHLQQVSNIPTKDGFSG